MSVLAGDLTTRIVSAGLDPDRLAALVRAALDEDLGGGSDVTTLATIGPDRHDTAEFVVREAGVVAGLLVAEVTMALVSGGTAVVEGPVREGVPAEAGTVALSVRGATADLLTGERVALNFVRHLSGVATLTHRFVAAVEGTGAVILDTRKTTPLLRALEKYAVRCGGGTNHRMTLSDMALVKDNHIIAAGGIAAAYAKVRGLAGTIQLADDAGDHLVRLAGGDARRALTYLEAAAGAARSRQATLVDVELLELAVDQAAVRYDRAGDQHYDVISAFIKSIRGSDVDAALHYLARMIAAGEDPRFIARRLVISASEDIGLADPTALTTAVAAAQAVQLIGMPEARLNLGQAVIALALAPKSNAVIRAVDAALDDVRAGLLGTVPRHLRDAHYPGSSRLAHGGGYVYPHDDERGVSSQQYAPDEVAERSYYDPSTHGAEAAYAERLEKVKRILKGP